MAVTGDGEKDEFETESAAGSVSNEASIRARLRRVEGPIEIHGVAPPVQLLREYKGLTVADLLRDEIVDRLPGQVRTAVHHLERGDFAAAERALPGEFARVLPGPGARPQRPGRLLYWLLVTAVLVAGTLASFWF